MFFEIIVFCFGFQKRGILKAVFQVCISLLRLLVFELKWLRRLA